MLQLLIAILGYLNRPYLKKLPLSIPGPLGLLTRLTLICVFVGVSGGMLSGTLIKSGMIPDPGPNVLDQDRLSRTAFFFAAVIFAPILEELIFRAQLRRFSATILFVSLVFGACSMAALHTAWAFLISPIIFAPLFLLYRFTLAGSISRKFKFWKRLFPWYFYFTAICFALVHLSNFEKGTALLPFGILYTLPQLGIGLILGYTRMNYGLKYSIALHSLYNLTLTLLFLARLKS